MGNLEVQEKQFHRIVGKNGNLNIRNSRKVSIRDLYHDLLKISWPMFFVIFTGVFFCLNGLFGLIYSLIPMNQFEGFRYTEGCLMHFLESFFFSVQTFGTIGYGRVSPVGLTANFVVTLESYSSLFVVAVLTGLIFARFSRPSSKVIFSHHAVIRAFDGIPCLMFRIANSRQNYISDARIRVTLAMDNPKTRFREFTDLKLERDSSPLFALSWTIAHDIDLSSPLHGLRREEWVSLNAELIVTFSGIDTVLSQMVHAKSSYIAEEVMDHHDFVDVVRREPNGDLVLMLEHFHEVKPI